MMYINNDMSDSNALNLNYDQIKKKSFCSMTYIYLLKVHVGYMHEIRCCFFGVLDQAFSDSKATVE